MKYWGVGVFKKCFIYIYVCVYLDEMVDGLGMKRQKKRGARLFFPFGWTRNKIAHETVFFFLSIGV